MVILSKYVIMSKYDSSLSIVANILYFSRTD